MPLATGDISVQRSVLPEGEAGVDETVRNMAEMAQGEYGAKSARIRALAINIMNAARVADKDYFGMIKAIHNWVRDEIRYIRDPINQETLSYPEELAFNTKAGDCDDKSILEMALLGSIGIKSYPVVVGTVAPGVYTHVYIHIQVPPGRGYLAGKIIAADPIMREWPLGKEVDAAKVKAKKLYSELAGLGMNLGAYATGPSYIDEQNVDSVVPAMNSVLTDTGSRGRVMNTQQVLRPWDDLDTMFQRGAIRMPFQPASKADLHSLGPITQRGAALSTSYLQDIKPQRIPERRTGPKTVLITDKKAGVAPVASTINVHGLMGLGDAITALSQEAKRTKGMRSVTGRHDVVYKAGAALALARKRAAQTATIAKQKRYGIAMFGLGADPVANENANLADSIAKLAATVADRAAQVAKQAVDGSPVRARALQATLAKLEDAQRALGLTSLVDRESASDNPYTDATAKVNLLTALAQDKRISELTEVANRTYDGDVEGAIASSPIGIPLADGSQVRDRAGNLLYNEGMAGFGSSLKKAIKKVTKVADKVLPEAHLLKLTKGVVKDIAQKSPLLKPLVKKSSVVRKALGIKLQPKAPKENVGADGGATYSDANGNPITQAQYEAQMAAMEHDQVVYDSAIAAINAAMARGGLPALTAEQIAVLQKYDPESFATYQALMAQPVPQPAPIVPPSSSAPYYPTYVPPAQQPITPYAGGSSMTPSYNANSSYSDDFGPDSIVSSEDTSSSDQMSPGGGFDPSADASGGGEEWGDASEQYDADGNLIMPEQEMPLDPAAVAAPAESGGFLPFALIGGAALYFFGKKH